MKLYHRVLPVVLCVLVLATIAGLVGTSRPIVAPRSRPAYLSAPFFRTANQAQDQFETARQLAARAVTREEQWMAREVLRIADGEVDLAFATALQEAAENPASLSPEAKSIAERLKGARARLEQSQAEAERLTKALAGARETAKDALQRQLQLVQAQLDLDQDEVDDARQDLIRAGGDPQGVIERMKQRYEAREQANGGLQNFVPSGPQNSVEETPLRNVVALARAWYSLHDKLEQVQRAEQAARTQADELRSIHEKQDHEGGKQSVQPPAPAASPSGSGAARLSALKSRASLRKSLEVLDKRVEDETQLADTYGRWSAFVRERQRQTVQHLLYGVLSILLVALLTTLADVWASRSFERLAADRRQARTLHSVVGYAIRCIGAILVLLVIFGPPTQFAAVLALAGAGLTVALRDFIVAFIGWFVLMGRNGIRVGDWVEIKGVSGEVLEIGPLRTILLETGDLSDAGHPTGRKVAFMNGFAVEGNYFNFSTTGQWMWDEIQLTVPAESDPFATAEAVTQIVAAETRDNARLAADEWKKVAPMAAPEAFRPGPVMSVRPTGSGASLVIRYITRATERHELRSRIYRAMIDLQRRDKAS